MGYEGLTHTGGEPNRKDMSRLERKKHRSETRGGEGKSERSGKIWVVFGRGKGLGEEEPRLVCNAVVRPPNWGPFERKWWPKVANIGERLVYVVIGGVRKRPWGDPCFHWPGRAGRWFGKSMGVGPWVRAKQDALVRRDVKRSELMNPGKRGVSSSTAQRGHDNDIPPGKEGEQKRGYSKGEGGVAPREIRLTCRVVLGGSFMDLGLNYQTPNSGWGEGLMERVKLAHENLFKARGCANGPMNVPSGYFRGFPKRVWGCKCAFRGLRSFGGGTAEWLTNRGNPDTSMATVIRIQKRLNVISRGPGQDTPIS